MTTLSTVIMAHPVRAAEVKELQGQLDRDVPVQWDPMGPPSSDPEQRWANGRAAWEQIDKSADWGMVIQDDAIVCHDLIAGLEGALATVPPDVVVQPYVGTKKPNVDIVAELVRQATEAQASWVTMRSLQWGVAIIAPTKVIKPMLAWADRRVGLAYDKRIGLFFRQSKKWRAWYPWPALVDHRQGPSICGHDNGGRMAHNHYTGSALALDWSGPVIHGPFIGGDRTVRKTL